MPGWFVPDMSTLILEGGFGRLYHDCKTWDPGFKFSGPRTSKQMKMCLLQLAFGLVVQRTASDMLDAFLFYLFSPDAFAVGMNQTR